MKKLTQLFFLLLIAGFNLVFLACAPKIKHLSQTPLNLGANYQGASSIITYTITLLQKCANASENNNIYTGAKIYKQDIFGAWVLFAGVTVNAAVVGFNGVNQSNFSVSTINVNSTFQLQVVYSINGYLPSGNYRIVLDFYNNSGIFPPLLCTNPIFPQNCKIFESFSVTCPKPYITTQPSSVSVCEGSLATFSVNALGSGNTYEWRINSGNIINGTLSSWTNSSLPPGTYLIDCRITNSCGVVTTVKCNYVVKPKPIITIPLSSATITVCQGAPATFVPTISNAAPATYTWIMDANPVNGATSLTYTNSTATVGTHTITLVVTTNGCSTTSAPMTLRVVARPVVVLNPISQSPCSGASSVTLVASFSNAYSYQWFKNGTAIFGETNPNLIINNPTAANNGNYTCLAYSQYGACSVSTTAASISVIPAVNSAVNFSPSPTLMAVGTPVTLSPVFGHNGINFLTTITFPNNGTVQNYTTQNVTFTPTTPGTYTITHYVGNLGCSSTTTYQLDIQPNSAQNAPLQYSNTMVYVADPVKSGDGSFQYEHTIFSNFKLFYNSRNVGLTNMGTFAWNHEYGWVLRKVNNSGEIIIESPSSQGNLYFIEYTGTLPRCVPRYAGTTDTLIKNTSTNTYLLETKYGVKYTFDASSGRLLSIKDRNNNQIVLTYNSAGKLTRITFPTSRRIDLIYTGNFLTSVFDGMHAAYFAYNGANDLIRLTNVRTGQFDFTYTNHLITDITDARGIHFIHNVYDVFGRVTHQDLADGGTYDLSYNTTNPLFAMICTVANSFGDSKLYYYNLNYQLVKITDELGNNQIFTYNNFFPSTYINENGVLVQYNTDNKGNITGIGIPSMSRNTTTTYNSLNVPTNIRNALGIDLIIGRDLAGNPLQLDFANGGTARIVYANNGLPLSKTDPMGRLYTYVYNAQLDLVTINTPTGTIIFSYDILGRLTGITDQMNNTISLTLDAWGNVTSVTDAMPQPKTIYMTWDANGNMTSYTNKNGQTTTFVYDNMDRVKYVISPMNDTIEHSYDLVGNLIRTDYPLGGYVTYAYDAKKRLTSSTTLLGTTFYQYDAADNVVRITLANGGQINMTYNNANELITSVNAIGATTQLTRNALGFVVSATDQLSRVSTYTFNSTNQLTSVSQSGLATTNFGVNLNGELISVTDANTHTVTNTIDAVGNKIAVADADNKNYTSQYDAVGNVIGGVDARGISFLVTRNNNYEVTDILWSSGERETYTLDNEGQATAITVRNASGSFNGTFNIVRNANGSIISVDSPFANEETSYSINALGLPGVITYESGKFVTNGYNSIGFQINISAWAGVNVTTTFDALGLVATRTYGGVITETITRNLNGDILTKTITNTAGNIFSQNISRNALGEVADNLPVPFIMPNFVNSVDNLTYRPNDVQTSPGFAHDDNGNITQFPNGLGDIVSAQFDGKNRIVTMQYGTTTILNTYDSGNFLIEQTKNGVTKRYVWDYNTGGLPHIIRETDAAGVTLVSYIWSGNTLVASIDAANVVSYYISDAFDNVVALANSAGVVTDQYGYGPSGQGMKHIGTSTNPFTWMGAAGILHQTGNIYYVRQRFFDGGNNRFLSQDSYPADALMTQSINRFVYGFNANMNWSDPSGLYSRETCSPSEAPLVTMSNPTLPTMKGMLIGTTLQTIEDIKSITVDDVVDFTTDFIPIVNSLKSVKECDENRDLESCIGLVPIPGLKPFKKVLLPKLTPILKYTGDCRLKNGVCRKFGEKIIETIVSIPINAMVSNIPRQAQQPATTNTNLVLAGNLAPFSTITPVKNTTIYLLNSSPMCPAPIILPKNLQLNLNPVGNLYFNF